jgi:hypothetical protein
MKVMPNNFVSGGRNIDSQFCCITCSFLEKRKTGRGGWCTHPLNFVESDPNGVMTDGFTPSVDNSGGCDLYDYNETDGLEFWADKE